MLRENVQNAALFAGCTSKVPPREGERCVKLSLSVSVSVCVRISCCKSQRNYILQLFQIWAMDRAVETKKYQYLSKFVILSLCCTQKRFMLLVDTFSPFITSSSIFCLSSFVGRQLKLYQQCHCKKIKVNFKQMFISHYDNIVLRSCSFFKEGNTNRTILPRFAKKWIKCIIIQIQIMLN